MVFFGQYICYHVHATRFISYTMFVRTGRIADNDNDNNNLVNTPLPSITLPHVFIQSVCFLNSSYTPF